MTQAADVFEDERRVVEKIHESRGRIERELSKVIVGQREATHQLLISLFAGGHCLITGAPGLAKTLLVRTIAQVFHLRFQRIQFTPDLMPADITGTEILEETTDGRRRMQFVKGPIFANVVLADEINRTPPKTQAALARSDAGAPGHRGRRPLSARRAVLRPGHAEPDRDGRDVPAPRGPARPVPVQRDRRLPARGRRGRRRQPDDLAQARADRAAVRRPGRAQVPRGRPQGADRRGPRPPRRPPGRRDPPWPVGPRLHQRVGELGRRPPRRRSRWSWGRRPGPCSPAGSTPRPRTFAPWSTPPSGTGSCSATGPRPTA